MVTFNVVFSYILSCLSLIIGIICLYLSIKLIRGLKIKKMNWLLILVGLFLILNGISFGFTTYYSRDTIDAIEDIIMEFPIEITAEVLE